MTTQADIGLPAYLHRNSRDKEVSDRVMDSSRRKNGQQGLKTSGIASVKHHLNRTVILCSLDPESAELEGRAEEEGPENLQAPVHYLRDTGEGSSSPGLSSSVQQPHHTSLLLPTWIVLPRLSRYTGNKRLPSLF